MGNFVHLIGRICNDLEIKETSNGKSYVNFTLAVSNGKDNPSDFIPCTLWNKGAEIFTQFTGKGGLVSVSGKLHITSVEKDGKKTNYTNVLVSDFEFLQSKPTGSVGKTQETPVKAPNKQIDAPVESEYDIPFEM